MLNLAAKVVIKFDMCKSFYDFLCFCAKKSVGKKSVGCSETVARGSHEVSMKMLRLFLSVSGMKVGEVRCEGVMVKLKRK